MGGDGFNLCVAFFAFLVVFSVPPPPLLFFFSFLFPWFFSQS